jgi:chaperonin GroEL (HSP60 family)
MRCTRPRGGRRRNRRGGGVALVRASRVLDDFKTEAEDSDEQIGVTIVKRALEEPLRQIAQNAGMEGAVIVGKVRENDSPTSASTLRARNLKIWSRLASLTRRK